VEMHSTQIWEFWGNIGVYAIFGNAPLAATEGRHVRY